MLRSRKIKKKSAEVVTMYQLGVALLFLVKKINLQKQVEHGYLCYYFIF